MITYFFTNPYRENIDFNGKDVVVKSTHGPRLTIIDGGSLASVIRFHRREGRDAFLDGFTVTGGRAQEGGGISIQDSSPTITGNVITGNLAVVDVGRGEGGGIAVSGGAPVIANNTITGNLASGQEFIISGGGYGGGGSIASGAATLVGNIIADNVAQNNGFTGGAAGGEPTSSSPPLRW